MALIPLSNLIRGEDAEETASTARTRMRVPLGGSRSEAIQRLKIGVGGLVAMVLLVGVANIIIDSARETESTTIAEAAAPKEEKGVQNDPLVDAGIVPDLPAEAEAEPLPEGPVVPEQGEGLPLPE